jgi:hypothetical protein
MRIGPLGWPQDRVAVDAACRDHTRVGDGDVVQVVSVDRIAVAGDFAAERRTLHLRLLQRPVTEQQLGH